MFFSKNGWNPNLAQIDFVWFVETKGKVIGTLIFRHHYEKSEKEWFHPSYATNVINTNRRMKKSQKNNCMNLCEMQVNIAMLWELVGMQSECTGNQPFNPTWHRNRVRLSSIKVSRMVAKETLRFSAGPGFSLLLPNSCEDWWHQCKPPLAQDNWI